MGEWQPSREGLGFVVRALKSHKRVVEFTEVSRNVFLVRRVGNPPIRVMVIDLYTVGYADVIEALSMDEDIKCLVTLSNWNGYTKEAKEYAKSMSIGLFKFSEFMGAIWKRDFWNYVAPDSISSNTQNRDVSGR